VWVFVSASAHCLNILRHQGRESLQRILYDPVEQLMALLTQHDQIEGTLVTIALISVVMHLQVNPYESHEDGF
jgi:hypothetical protein